MYEMLKKNKPSDTVQFVRKRVYGSSDPIGSSDLFYDRSDGKYYKNMREIRYCADCQIYPDEYHDYLRLNRIDRSAHTILLAQLPDGVTYIKSPQPLETGASYARPLQTNHYAGTLVQRGTEETSLPPMVLLFSEAEMSHAAKLASTMTGGEQFRRFLRIGNEKGVPDRASLGTKAPLIEATEYDDLEHVLARYSSNLKSSGNDTKDAFMAGRLMAVRHRTRYGNPDQMPDEDQEAMEEEMKQERESAIDKEFRRAQKAQAEKLQQIEDAKKARAPETGGEVHKAQTKAPKPITREKIAYNFNKGYNAVSEGISALKEVLASREGFDTMEVSYGGQTGDMAFRRVPHPGRTPGRQYSLIQSTFFWMPGVRSMDNAKVMYQFFRANYHNLLPEGIIRIISFSGKRSEGAEWIDKFNQYQNAAEWVCRQLKKIGYTDVGIELLKFGGKAQSYSDRLKQEGLNPGSGENPAYKPLWTDTRKIVSGGDREDDRKADGQKSDEKTEKDVRDNLIIRAKKPRRFLPV